MLLRYIVSNFKSIGLPIEFSMLPSSPDISDFDDRFIRTINTKVGPWKVLLRGGVFGPNAAGKTAFAESMYYARTFILDLQSSGKPTRVKPFRGEIPELHGKTTFQFMIYTCNDVFQYGFSLDSEQVYEERLDILEESGFNNLFVRHTDLKGNTDIAIGAELARDGETLDVVRLLVKTFSANQKNLLFLNRLYENGINKINPVINWFQALTILNPSSTMLSMPRQMKENIEFRKFIGSMLHNMDTGIDGINVASEKMDIDTLSRNYNIPIPILQQVEDSDGGIFNADGKFFISSHDGKNGLISVKINFDHKLNGKVVPFDLNDESDGTQRLIDLIPMLFIERNSNAVFVVDEIDRSLHTKLSQYFLDYFLNQAKGNSRLYSQMIFTSHDVNLLNLSRFSKDELWFIEKNKDGQSNLHSLSDYDVKKDHDVLKDYLCGRFGAVPIIGGVDIG